MNGPTRANGEIPARMHCRYCQHRWRPVDKTYATHCPNCHEADAVPVSTLSGPRGAP